MKLKKGSIIFLSILFVILIFIVGVRYGQRVEKTNKITDYIISILPSPTLQPTPTEKPLEFKTYKHTGCKIQFLYPSNFKISIESSDSARLETAAQSIYFNCSKESSKSFQNEPKLATEEVKIKEESIKAKIKPDLRTIEKASPTLLFNLINPRTNKNIFFEISQSLLLLFEKSLEFSV
ncbi:hypothetical protein A3A46_01005 [Candidatus Roizmanbacteria bacterium RIFCSPLOWO2_01_FULL_37_13]|uniref:Uncharacterized protein n=1 Tax=Candidatus Roizmanbacteria bacterium RIFCSPHIGHO2_02_FULL_38_11 TaxID=1802039 RepID=A0A1F7GYR8_9BACT|nr:MAG: hypothetical protein A3C25_05465 [Candidatus Roizmanbacteria bacterium RIFCSPHIGHO2_02_FULL_38_11]OGK35503.1 MAG: hypothetical protein A3F58_00985 [Candidatus Roizmanbacteria bacterium RIFCSPHIGHO2_12_FULL_37_9b]OGK41266.1 MAG: hypothetical protein A3A46_01005 [Candidatus Roizmanbacteria bacterium RIFCSPLOWO2_01_FULL_37_13]